MVVMRITYKLNNVFMNEVEEVLDVLCDNKWIPITLKGMNIKK